MQKIYLRLLEVLYYYEKYAQRYPMFIRSLISGMITLILINPYIFILNKSKNI